VVGTSCDLQCVDNMLYGNPMTCDDEGANIVCGAMVNCGCVYCRRELLQLPGCQSGCTYECQCTNFYAPFCVNCIESITASFNYPMTCDSYNAQVCAGFDSCDCGSCISLLEDCYTCKNTNCEVDCSNVVVSTPSPTKTCQSITYGAFQQCVSNECVNCLGDAFDRIFGGSAEIPCETLFDTQFCQAIEACGCVVCLI
jgi:hypothetical protein